ncbi:MAG: four helix bundle protein [bacterium]|nr:four helix bundle protein [bacterium]
MFHSFEELDVWKKACQLCVELHSLLSCSNALWLRDQMLRAALSIASNIAEGAERNARNDFIRFLNIAKASAAELRTQLYIAVRIGAVQQDRAAVLIEETKTIAKMIQALIAALRKPGLATENRKLKTEN